MVDLVDLTDLANKLNQNCSDYESSKGNRLKWTKENLLEGKSDCYIIPYCGTSLCLDCKKILDETLRNQIKKHDICESCVSNVMFKISSRYGNNSMYFSEEIVHHHVLNYHYNYCSGNCAVVIKIKVIKERLQNEEEIDSESLCDSLDEIIKLLTVKKDNNDND